MEQMFNPKSPTTLHIDINSCFATIEQQANPKLRGKPIAVAASISPYGCIVAPSVEAKTYGISVGMRIREAKQMLPNIIILEADPDKYRWVHTKLRALLEEYTDRIVPKSIDEFVLETEGYPAFASGMERAAREIKARIRKEIGEWIRVSVGIGPNRFLAKTAAGLHKPDGLDTIDRNNVESVFAGLALTKICGIKSANALRLNMQGIYTALDFFHAPLWKLKAAFASVTGYYWYMRLRGWELDDVEFSRGSYGNSYVLTDTRSTPEELTPLLMKLAEKTASRMRKNGYRARGVYLFVGYRTGVHWHKRTTLAEPVFDTRDIYRAVRSILLASPFAGPVLKLAVSCFSLEPFSSVQGSLFADVERKERLVHALDHVTDRWGDFAIMPARMIGLDGMIVDRIAFGK